MIAAAPPPAIYFEQPAQGRSFIRVEEPRSNPVKTAATAQVFAKRVFRDRGVYAAVAVKVPVDVDIHDYVVDNERLGVSLMQTGTASIYNLEFDGFSQLKPERYGSVIRLGTKRPEDGTTGITYVQRVYADGHEEPIQSRPDLTYAVTNKDFLTINNNNGDVYLRDVTASSFSDAIIDAKAPTTVYIINATFSDAHRMLRIHEGAHIVIVNSRIDTPDGQSAVWMKGDATLEYYNCSWNGEATLPRALIDRDSDPDPNITKLSSNPLSEMEFFRSAARSIHVETSRDNRQWSPLKAAEESRGPVGDPLYPLGDQADGDYYVRGYYVTGDGIRSGYSRVLHHRADGSVEDLP